MLAPRVLVCAGVFAVFGFSCAWLKSPEYGRDSAVVKDNGEAGKPAAMEDDASAATLRPGAEKGDKEKSRAEEGKEKGVSDKREFRYEEEIDSLPFTERRRALTETLEEAARRLASRKAENVRLKEEIGELEERLEGRKLRIEELKAGIESYDERVTEVEESLRDWRYDVLGFREEMRDYHEAQIEVLKSLMNVMQRSAEGGER